MFLESLENMIWPAWVPPLGRLLKPATVMSCNLREFLSNCGILIKLSVFFKYFMISFTLSASVTVEFLNLALASHVWNEISGLVILETQLSWLIALWKSFLFIQLIIWLMCLLFTKSYLTDTVDIILLIYGDCKVCMLG